MRRVRHMRAWLAVLASVTACAHESTEPLVAPEFGPPRAGVFNPPTPLVENPEDDMMPTLAGSTGLIAYVSKQGGNLDVFVRSQATALVRRLTTHSADDTDPAFSPDGKRIAWIAQTNDVKGDVWVMNTNGDGKTQLTERDAAESAPAWSADGKVIYFTTRPGDTGVARIDAIELSGRKRAVVLDRAWDPAPSPDGKVLVYAAADTNGLPRLFARRLDDGRVAAVTDGVYIDALPRFAMLDGEPTIVFTRFVDDSTGDGKVASDDEASLWATTLGPELFDTGAIAEARPLTPGAGGELLAAIAPNWLAYTAAGYADLEIYALPADGMVQRDADGMAVLEAARAEADPALRRLALRHIIATGGKLRGRARYELGRELETRGKFTEARIELQRAVSELDGDELQGVAAIEIERVNVLQLTGGHWEGVTLNVPTPLDEAAENATRIAKEHPARPAQDRLATTLAELDLVRGRYAKALASFEANAAQPEVAAEDGARSLAHASSIYARFADLAAIERICSAMLSRFGTERRYVEGCTATWLSAAKDAAHGQPASAFEDIGRRYDKLPAVAAPAMYRLGQEQAGAHPRLAIATWQNLVATYPTASSTVSDALIALGETAERVEERAIALAAYEQLLAQFGSDPRVRGRARAGATRLALAKADKEELEGKLEQARESYARLLDKRRDNALAHRRYIAVSARLGKAAEVIASYEAQANARPRDAVARYAYGYALTFAEKLVLTPAEREIGDALDLDPRFAAAHLTMGWIRMQREQRSPGRDWLDRAESSFRTALELVDPETDPQLWAAAQLNRANALLGLGKNDDAFNGFLTRNAAFVRFDDDLTQLLFFESFSRAAWRMDELDVALDMAHQEWLFAKALPGEPRLATAAALQASIYLQAQLHEDAVTWYERAEQLYRARQDWTRLVPMLRGKALALRALGRDDEALNTFADLLDLTSRGIGVPEPDKPFLSFLAPEIPANPTNVTRAPYGFLAKQEEEVARASAARTLRSRGDLSRARTFAAQRLKLIDDAAEDEITAARIQPELLHALNESALIEAQAGDEKQAMVLWNRALTICQANGYTKELVVILESLAMLWAREPGSRDEAMATRARALANAMMDQTRAADAAMGLRLQRWLALERFAGIFMPEAAQPGAQAKTFAGQLDELDAMNGELDAVLALVPEDLQLVDSLRAYTGTADGTVAAPVEELMGPPLPMAQTVAASWRTAFDTALASRSPLDAAKLTPVVDAYETYGGGRAAPERRAFIDAASRAFIDAKNYERAWRLLERARLEDLDPGPRRRTAAASHLATRPILLRTLDAKPATLAEIRAALAEGETILQMFATHDAQWTWVLIDAKRLEAVRTGPMTGAALPDEVATLLGTPEATVYVDFGGHQAPPLAALTSHDKPVKLVSEALSASYVAAAFESASLARRAPVTFTEPTMTQVESEGHGKLLLRFTTTVTGEEPAEHWVGPAQLTFSKPATAPESETVDLDRIAARSLGSGVAWVDTTAPSPRVTRSLAQAFLLAGVPTVLVGHVNRDIAEKLGSESAATLMAQARDDKQLGDDARIVGYRGPSFVERIDIAFVRLLTLAKSAGSTYPTAAKTQRREDWQRAHDDFAALVDIVELLLEPDALPVLAASKRPGAAALAKTLDQRLLDMREKLSFTKLALKDVDAAAAIQESLVDSYAKAGNLEAAAKRLLEMGKTFLNGERYRDAERVLTRCASLAADKKLHQVEGDCRSRLGSAYRGLFENDKARAAYQKAIDVYAAANDKNQLYPKRFMGLLYETALNDYDEALGWYRRALADATTMGEPDMVPTLNLDIARTYRARGDFGLALESVTKAREALPKDDKNDRAEASLEAAKIEWYRGDYPSALDEQTAALNLARANRNDFQEIQALSLGGLIAMNRGDLTTARESVSSALDLARGSGRRREEAAQLNNLGTVLQQAGKLDAAEATFRAALELDTQLNGTEGQAFDLRNLAAVLERRGKAAESLAAVDKALALSKAIGSRYNEAQCLYVRGRALLASGRAAEASESFSAAHDLAVQLSIPEIDWRASYAAGRIAESSGDVQKARAAYDTALAVAERLSRSGDEGSVEDSRDTLYADAVRLALAEHDDNAAFTLIERRHARALLDLVAASDVLFPDADSRRMVADERRAREAVIGAEREQKRVGGDDAKVRTALTEHTAALNALRTRYPGIARAFTIAPRQVSEVQSVLRDDSAVVLYLIGVKQSNALVVRKSGLTRIPLAIAPKDLRQLADDYREALRAFGGLEGVSAQLGEAVLAPLGDALKGAQHVVIVPHGPLVGIPFAALPWQNGQLIDALTTSYAPSASALVDTLSRPQRGAPKKVAAGAHGSDLPFARLEALAVAGGGAVLGPAATESAVRALQGDAIDIAAHGDVNVSEPMRASLRLAQGEYDDGALELREVFGFQQPLAPLVTLSACTLGGSDAAWAAVASSFFASGTQTVVASQERVSDLAAGVLMKRFYRERNKGGAGALRAAQLWTRAYFEHPGHWATFSLLGDFR